MKKELKASFVLNNGFYTFLLSIAICALPVFYLSCERGQVSSFPILIYVAFIFGIFAQKRLYIACGAAVIAFIVSLFDYSDILFSALYTCAVFAAVLICALCGGLVSRFIREKRVAIRIASLASCFAILTLLVLSQWGYFGTPSALSREKKYIEEYVRRYSQEEFSDIRTSYNVFKKEYRTTAIFYNGSVENEVTFVHSGSSVKDGYSQYVLDRAADFGRMRLTTLLRAKFPEENFKIKAHGLAPDEVTSEIFIGDAEEISLENNAGISYDIYFEGINKEEYLFDFFGEMFDYIEKSAYEFESVFFYSPTPPENNENRILQIRAFPADDPASFRNIAIRASY